MKRVLGNDHPHVLQNLSCLASAYCENKQFDDSIRLLQSVLERRKRVLGVQHFYTLQTMDELKSTFALRQGSFN